MNEFGSEGKTDIFMKKSNVLYIGLNVNLF